MSLELLLAESIANGLKRASITGFSKWAENYRVMKNGPWSFRKHPWLRDMHDSMASLNVGQKAAQMGFTETILNIALGSIDLKGQDVLYLLPSKVPDATDFSSARFDPALELSEHLNKLFSDVKNTGHKRAGAANLYIRGAQSRAGLKSIPVNRIFMDELEEFNPEAVALALERVSGQDEKFIWMVSTPTIEGVGINRHFLESTMEHFFFKCPACSRKTELTFPECVEIFGESSTDPRVHESYYKCKECKNRLDHTAKVEIFADSEWVAEHPDRTSRGFHVNQLYSPTITPGELVTAYFRSLVNNEDEQEFYNSKLGVTHVVKGARVDDELINLCTQSHRNAELKVTQQVTTMGVDIGKWLHYEIDQWIIPAHLKSNDINNESFCKVIEHGKVQTFEELDPIMNRYMINACVVDANPEKRAAVSFAKRFYGRVKVCYYARGIAGKTINVGSDLNEPSINVDRTAWLDTSLGRFHNQTIGLPIDTDIEYKSHIKAPVRIYEKDKDGNPVGRYVNGSKDDHYAHARNYSEIALVFAFSHAKNVNIGNIL